MAENDTLELPGGIGRRVGPLPLYAWIGAGLAGIGLAVIWTRRRREETETAVATEVDADGNPIPAGTDYILPTSFAVGGGVGATGSSGGGSVTGDGVPTTEATDGYATNGAWKRAALSALVAAGYSAVIADDALGRYLESQQLTSQQAELVNRALQIVGPVPEPVPAAPAPPPDATQPTSAPSGGTAAPVAPAAWVRPSWLAGSKFIIADTGGPVYLITASGIEWVPSESAFYALGGGGTVNLASGPYTYGRPGTPPTPVPQSVIDGIPKVGQTP